ncbi:MAG: hypothetical protein LBJ00_17300 [Planctomycetaceae bacterium]|nr:hypothetical protein [Planctomycetaceae bacterium]
MFISAMVYSVPPTCQVFVLGYPITFSVLGWRLLRSVWYVWAKCLSGCSRAKPDADVGYGVFVIPKPVWAVGFALEQPLRDATLACSASGILK